MSGEIIQLSGKFCEGAFAAVILSAAEGIARNLFKRIPDETMLWDQRPWENEIRRETFPSEVDAYIAAMASSDARALLPEFRGVLNISQALDAAGNDISDRYLLDCCFAMEFLPDTFQKLLVSGKPIVPEGEAKKAARILADVGIHYLIDASVRLDPTAERIEKTIDFAMRDAYQEGEHKRLFFQR